MTRQSPRGGAGAPDRAHRHGRQPQRESRRARSLWLAVAGYLGLALVCLGSAAMVLLLVVPPLDAVRERLIRKVHDRTGRMLNVAGPMSLSLLPRPLVTLQGIALLPPEGMAGGPTVTVPSLDAEISLWSLLSRRPKLERLTLHRPKIDLAVDAQGRRSWDAGPKPQRPATPKAAQPEPGSQAAARPRRPRPTVVRVVDGMVHYRDERTGTSYEIGALNLDLTADAPEAALALSGAFAWEDTPFRFSVTAPREPKAAAVIKLSGAPLEAVYEGSLAVQGGVAAVGTLSISRLSYNDLKVGPAKLALAIAADTVKVTLQEVAFYGGLGQGSLTLDAAGATPALSTDLTLTGVSLQPLLKDAAGASWLEGRAAVTLVLSGQGASGRKVVETLQGQVKLAVAEGAVTGFDADRILRALQRGRLDRLAPRREDRTPFSALTGTFDIHGGIAKTGDLKLVSKQIELKGEGQIELAERRIDATLQTKIDGGAPADGAVVNIGTLVLPIGIKGALDRPEFTIKGQEGLADAINRIGKNLKSREVQDAIEGLLSGDRSKRVKPGELLDKLFKKE